MAARLAPSSVPADALGLAGQGLRDVTRIAAGDSALWTQILSANAGPVAEVVAAVAEDLAAAARELAAASRRMSAEPPGPTWPACSTGAGPGSPASRASTAAQPRNFRLVQVVIADRPGELARLFNAAGAAGVNIEDIRLEHSPGLPVGVAELSIRPDQAGALLDAMEAGGWPVRS